MPCSCRLQRIEPAWTSLFGTPGSTEERLPCRGRVLTKNGKPLLLLPEGATAAAHCFKLYPAQTHRARLLRQLAGALVRLGFPGIGETTEFSIPRDDPFLAFLRELVGTPLLPRFGVLAGNPASSAQRFMLLVFDSAGSPRFVVKAGVSEPAKLLLRKETSFLKEAGGNAPGIPKLRGTFCSPNVEAFALDFFGGDSPKLSSEKNALALLSCWTQPGSRVPLAECPDWKRLLAVTGGDQRTAGILDKLAARTVSSTLCHGDFAPWNIKVVSGREWVVLDWERGVTAGIPGWDWFHFLVQPAILVRHMSTAQIVFRLERALDEPDFQEYARKTGVSGFERDLVFSYLLNMVEVIQPSEGLKENRELLEAWCAASP